MNHAGEKKANFLSNVDFKIKIGIIIVLLLAMIWIISVTFGTGFDWENFFKPATLALLVGESPYTVPGFYSPPWLLLPFIPLALLPTNLGGAILFVLNLLSFAFVAYRLGAKPLTMVILVFSPQVIAGSFAANVDWIAILGFLLPPQIGLFFVLLKPQIGLGVAIFWFVEAWRRGKIKEVVKVFAPVTLAYILSFIIFGFWPARYLELPESVWNTSMFPYSIAIGLVLLGLAIKNRSLNYSITASPLLSPYVAWYTWPVSILGLLPSQVSVWLAVAGLWLAEAFSGFPIFRSWFVGN